MRQFPTLTRASAAAMCLLVAGTGLAPADIGSGGGILAYTWQPSTGGLHEIHVVNVDGSGERQLIHAPIGLNHHEWSPDARRIATVGYIGTDNATWSIHVVDAEGGNLHRLTAEANIWDSEPTWSPDGTRIAFCRIDPNQGFRSELWLMNADGSDAHWIGELGFAPRWSPNGMRFVFQTSLFGPSDIHTCAVDGSDVRVLFASPDNDGNPDWSPDGAQIAFSISRDGNLDTYEIWLMDADGTGAVRLTENAVYDDLPRWSPDGTMLAFHSRRAGHAEVHVMNADGSDVRQVTTMPAGVTAINPSWCPLLSGPYLGQVDYGATLVRFVPFPYLANVEWFWHGAPAFSPGGLEMYWTRYSVDANRTGIWMTRVENGIWTWPRRAHFSDGTYGDNCPIFSTTGDTLYFQSSRPGGNIFRVERLGDAWSTPEPLPLAVPPGTSPGLQFSVARNGNVYGELWVNNQNDLDLVRWRLQEGVYMAPEDLGPSVNSETLDYMPYIDPDERFLIFTSRRLSSAGSNDIWLCARTPDGEWSQAVNAGPEINTGETNAWPALSPEGDILFVTSGREGDQGFNPYWIDAGIVLDRLVPVDRRSFGSVKALYR